jgi:transposase
MKEKVEFEQVIERGCGLDVHKETVTATIKGEGIKQETREFSTYTRSLISLRDWLLKNGITHVAMESTGVYWKPVFNILGEHFQIILVNARHVKNVPGRKTDQLDSQWLAKLLMAGLLKASFIPIKKIRELKDLVRYKTKLTRQVSSEKNRFVKILEDANIKLSSVLTDIFCVTGMKMIREIIECDYDPDKLLYHVHGSVKKSRSEIKEAITGYVTDHHRFMMQTILESIEKTEDIIAKIDSQIAEQTKEYGLEIELLETIPGVGHDGAIGIISEIGVDMSVFPDEKHIAKWAGMCPGNNETAGKKKSSRASYGNAYIRALLVQLAWSASRTKKTYLSSKYKSLVRRMGKKKAIVAVGHKILIASYFIIKDKVAYNELGEEYLSNFRKDKLVAYYKKMLQELEPNLEFETKVA